MSSQLSTEISPLLSQPSSPASAHNAPHQAHSPPADKVQTGLAFKIVAAMYSFVVLGLLTSSIGVILPHISHHYDISDLHVSFIFLVGPIGYIIAAQSNHFIHSRFGQRGVAILGPIFHLLSTLTIAVRPPFPVVLVAFAMVAAGTGLLDGSWCAWAASMGNANTVSGLLHGSFSIGAAIGPFLASTMISDKTRQWNEWYFVLAASSAIELVVLLCAFRYDDASAYRLDERIGTLENVSNFKSILMHLATYISAAYFLAYVGTETAISGWVVSFMTRARHATPPVASLASSGFWAGMAVGRLALGALTDRMGVSQATFIYFLCIISLETLFVALKYQAASLVCLTLLGFFMGPLFPSGVVLLTRLLPKEDHIPAVSLVASVGQTGGALLPFGIGALVHRLGIGVFQYAIMVFSFLAMVMWIAFSRIRPAGSVILPEDRTR